MESFVKQYGMVVVYAIIGILIIGVLYGVFRESWKSVGVVEDGIKTDFLNDEWTFKKPFLLVENQKIVTGKRVSDARTFAQARDIDDEMMEKSKIIIKEIEGKILNNDLSLNTSEPAKSILEYKVTGKNGKTATQRVIVLVD